MQYEVVHEQDQDAIRQPRRAAWFSALIDNGMLKVPSRPTLSNAQKTVLDDMGLRMRTRNIKDDVYVWVEDIPSSDLNEAADDDIPLD